MTASFSSATTDDGTDENHRTRSRKRDHDADSVDPGSRPVPGPDQAVDDLSAPNPSEEAVSVYRYLHDTWGTRFVSGQQHEPWWGVDELAYVESVTGRLPAIMGADFIHDDKERPVNQSRDWWGRGGIPTIMWHWGAPGEELEDEYDQSLVENVDIDVWDVFESGTPENDAFWTEMAAVATRLETLRDEGVPVLWRPFHEFDGGWFWWGGQGPEPFVELWRTMHEYFVGERGLNNLIWVLPHAGEPDGDWHPGEAYVDIAGGDTYPAGPSANQALYDDVGSIHGDDRPIGFHEVGIPPHPDRCVEAGAWWGWWMQWHTNWVTDETDEDYLEEVYAHDLVVTLDDVPDLVAEYGFERDGLGD